ncbi:hypothetical protein [Sphingobium cloacae]|nr:hypothetical protein [Sphingobium cloacae]
MVYKAFAAATLVLALLVGVMADRFVPVRAPEGVAAPMPMPMSLPVAEVATAAYADPSEEDAVPPPDMPAEMPAFGQPMIGADTPSLSPGHGLPEAPVSSIEAVEAENAG